MNSSSPRIGLVAAWGRYPIVVAEALARQGYEVYCLGVKDHADPALKTLCHHFQPLGGAKLGAAIRYFKRHGVTQATMAGKYQKVRLLGNFAWIKHFPDLRSIRTFWHHFGTGRHDRKDDTLLLTLINAFAQDGIHFAPATDFAPELLVTSGQLTGGRLTAKQRQDIAFGWRLAKEMGRLDVGQSVAVIGQAVLAVEAVEGTDECIRRAGSLCPSGGFTVVKVAKPQQDMRFDVPTVGVDTLKAMIASGAKTLAIEAGKTILLDEAEFLALARKHGITVVALDGANSLAIDRTEPASSPAA